MRKTLGVTLVLLVLSIGADAVRADTINGTFDFIIAPGAIQLQPTGSFVFDTNTNSFTSFPVSWDGFLFDFTAAANSYAAPNECGGIGMFIQVLTSPSCSKGTWDASGSIAFFTINAPNDSFIQVTLPSTAPIDDTYGTFTVSSTTTATPEPSVLASVLSGIGLVCFLAAMRKHSHVRFRKSS